MSEAERQKLDAQKRYLENKLIRRPDDEPEKIQGLIDTIDAALAAHPPSE